MADEFFRALLGGALIGLASILLLLANGRIAGVSGILGGVAGGPGRANGWNWAFLGGLIACGAALRLAGWTLFSPLPGRSLGALVTSGLLVGFGTQVGSGCTSGHGVCGLGRKSFRSLAATLTFIATGALTVALVRAAGGPL